MARPLSDNIDFFPHIIIVMRGKKVSTVKWI